MFDYDEIIYGLNFKDEEIEKLLSKFNRENMQIFDLIIYFSGFEPNMKELVKQLKEIKEKAYNNTVVSPKDRIENEINRCTTRELDYFIAFLNQSEFCASCDNRYAREATYLDYIRTVSERASARKIHDKLKIKTKKIIKRH